VSDSPHPPPADSPPSPIAVLHALAIANPEDPCVFFPDRLGDWRWKPWRWLQSEASRWAAALRDVEPGAKVGYRWRPTPEAIAADLGIQLAGGIAVPVTEGDEAAVPQLAAWLPVGEPVPEGRRAPTVDRTLDEFHGTASTRELRAAAGGALVRKGETWHQQSQGDLAAAAAALASAPTRERPIALVAGDLAAAEERAWLAWAITAGAALVLPGDPAFAAWAIFWPRPTDVCLPAEQLAPVRELFATLGTPRIQRSRLKRIRRLLVYGGEPTADETTAWQALGVSLASRPLLSP
jgi:hypothetical protein